MTVPESSEPLQIPPMVKRDSSLAAASLVCGLLTWFVVPFFGALAAVITGHLARKEIRDSQGTMSGDGMAVAGLILGYVQLGLMLLVGIGLTLALILFSSGDPSHVYGSFTYLPALPRLF